MPEQILRRVATDNDYVKKRVDVLERWAQSGEMEPWKAVLMAELIRKEGGRGVSMTDKDFEELFMSEEMVEIMRAQVDGPWMVYVEQTFSERSNNFVMGFLGQLEDAASNAKP